MPSVEELYQEIILEHNKHPRNFGVLMDATHSASGNNPLCGDEILVQVKIGNGRITGLKFTGQGCAISRASASMMTEALSGKPVDQAQATLARILDALNGRGDELTMEKDGDLVSIAGVRKFPARIKCATLAWHALGAALEGTDSVSTESTS